MPAANELPASLAELTNFNACEIREATLEQDVSRLIIETKSARPLNRYRWLREKRASALALALVLMLAAVISVYWA